VQVVSVEGAMTPGPSGEDLAQALARHGIATLARHVTPRDRTAGQIFIDEAKATGADLMVKGAYTQSRLRQMIFGGATRHILAHATLPVLMAN